MKIRENAETNIRTNLYWQNTSSSIDFICQAITFTITKIESQNVFGIVRGIQNDLQEFIDDLIYIRICYCHREEIAV